MAEFSEIIKQLGRICESNFGECDICDLRPFCPSRTFLDKYAKSGRAERLEKMVMKWAAEHPEPVYPLWGEWLISIGAARREPTGIPFQIANGDIIDPPYKIAVNLYDPIPAEIAQKLGIEPVPIVHCDCGATNETDAKKKLGLN